MLRNRGRRSGSSRPRGPSAHTEPAMSLKRARGEWIAWLCIALGLLVALYSALRLVSGRGGALGVAVGLPTLTYGVLMLRAVRRVEE